MGVFHVVSSTGAPEDTCFLLLAPVGHERTMFCGRRSEQDGPNRDRNGNGSKMVRNGPNLFKYSWINLFYSDVKGVRLDLPMCFWCFLQPLPVDLRCRDLTSVDRSRPRGCGGPSSLAPGLPVVSGLSPFFGDPLAGDLGQKFWKKGPSSTIPGSQRPLKEWLTWFLYCKILS